MRFRPSGFSTVLRLFQFYRACCSFLEPRSGRGESAPGPGTQRWADDLGISCPQLHALSSGLLAWCQRKSCRTSL
ncbi:hypothetical protein R3P38DRAFT_2845891, partial [Favolaschia claudopus]